MAGAPSYGSVFQQLYDTSVETMSAGAGALIADGQELAGLLLFIVLALGLISWMISGDGVTALVDGIRAVMRWGVVSFLLLTWLATVGGFFQGIANDIGGRLAAVGVSAGSGSAGQRVADTVNTIMIGAGRLLSSERIAPTRDCTRVETPPSTPEEAVAAVGEDCVTAAGQNAELGWIDMLKYFPAIMFTWLLRLIALFFMGMMVAAYLAVIFLADILFGVGITLGPILVPWLIWQQTEWLFDGWLRFMVASTLTKIVAGLMTSLITGVILAVKTVSEKTGVTDAASLVAVDEFTAFLLCIVCALGTFFMWQVPGIAQGLVSGSGGLGLKNFGRNSGGSALKGSPTGTMKMAGKGLENWDKVVAALKTKGGK